MLRGKISTGIVAIIVVTTPAGECSRREHAQGGAEERPQDGNQNHGNHGAAVARGRKHRRPAAPKRHPEHVAGQRRTARGSAWRRRRRAIVGHDLSRQDPGHGAGYRREKSPARRRASLMDRLVRLAPDRGKTPLATFSAAFGSSKTTQTTPAKVTPMAIH